MAKDKHVEVKGHKRRHPKPMPRDIQAPPPEKLSSPMLAQPPGGNDEGFGGDSGGFGGM